MSFKSALSHSINNKNNQHLEKNLHSKKCLFVSLWAAAATDGSELRERLDIDAFGGLQRTGVSTILTMYESKSSTPGGCVGVNCMIRASSGNKPLILITTTIHLHFLQTSTSLTPPCCLHFTWISTRAAHKSLCPEPLQLVTRVLIPKSEKAVKKYMPRNVGNRLITIEYV